MLLAVQLKKLPEERGIPSRSKRIFTPIKCYRSFGELRVKGRPLTDTHRLLTHLTFPFSPGDSRRALYLNDLPKTAAFL